MTIDKVLAFYILCFLALAQFAFYYCLEKSLTTTNKFYERAAAILVFAVMPLAAGSAFFVLYILEQ